MERIHAGDSADIKLAIGEICLRCDPHAIAVKLRIGKCGQESKFVRGRIRPIDPGEPHRKSRQLQQQGQKRQGIAAKMVIGAQQIPFKAHAWVEVDGRAVNDKSYMGEKYPVLEKC